MKDRGLFQKLESNNNVMHVSAFNASNKKLKRYEKMSAEV